MKILCFTDNHFCERSSIVTKYGTKYSLRLENQLASINWVEQLAIDGTKKPGGCKFTVVIPEMAIAEPIQIIPCTEKAVNSISGVAVWQV